MTEQRKLARVTLDAEQGGQRTERIEPVLRASVGILVRGGVVYAGPYDPREVGTLRRAEHALSLSDGLALARVLGIEAEVVDAVREQALYVADQARKLRTHANDAHASSMDRAAQLDADATCVLNELRSLKGR